GVGGAYRGVVDGTPPAKAECEARRCNRKPALGLDADTSSLSAAYGAGDIALDSGVSRIPMRASRPPAPAERALCNRANFLAEQTAGRNSRDSRLYRLRRKSHQDTNACSGSCRSL